MTISPVSTTTVPVSSIRVAAVPAGHPYVRAVTADPRIAVLADPTPPGAEPGRWWPPVILDAEWIGAHASAADLLHIHFGTESFDPPHLVAAIEAAHANGWTVLMTVHDLVHPQLHDQAPYLAQLDAVLPRVDAVITLTDGAAAEIQRRWNRTATVLPHPRLLGDDVVLVDAAPNDSFVVGVALKDLRPNVDPVGSVRATIAAVAALTEAGTPARAEVRMHRSVRDEAARDEVRALAAAPGVTLIEHDRLDDTALAQTLAGLDAAVLPYSSGTHSGWLELCWDLGVPVAAPDAGYYAHQHLGTAAFTAGDGASLAAALTRLLAEPRAGTAERTLLRAARRGERRTVDQGTAAAHAEIYQRLLAGGSA